MSESVLPSGLCVALSGGVGGAKLALGLSRCLADDDLLIVANTGDDFEHLGLHVSPDLDTVMYTLAGLSNLETGWGLAGESWGFLEALEALGGETWFRLGDRDLATHVERSRRLRQGESLSEVTRTLCSSLGIEARIVPMTDDRVSTVVHSDAGDLDFQHYFVREGCRPAVSGFHFAGIEDAAAAPEFQAAITADELCCVIVCPSNPFVSVDPILLLPGVAGALLAGSAPIVAVSPIVGGEAIKGPAAKMMRELDLPVSAVEVARHYRRRDLLHGFVLDEVDAKLAPEIEDLGLGVLVTDTVMNSLDDRVRLAQETLAFACRLA